MRKALNKKQEDWAYEQWCKGYTMLQIAEALFVSDKVIHRAINHRPRIRPVLKYDFESEAKA